VTHPDDATEPEKVADERAREVAIDAELGDAERDRPDLDPETEQALRDRLT
jgi:hypothetical protein